MFYEIHYNNYNEFHKSKEAMKQNSDFFLKSNPSKAKWW